MSTAKDLVVKPIASRDAREFVKKHHYSGKVAANSQLHLGVFWNNKLEGVMQFGPSLDKSRIIPLVEGTGWNDFLELNRMAFSDVLPRNSESWFISRALALLPPKIVLSYADTAAGHMGYVYRASNFHYAGWTDMDRKTPRFDYITPGMHTRDAFRKGERRFTERVRRKPKVRYWITTGNRRERKALEAQCLWPKMDWKLNPPSSQHQQHKM